MPLGKIEQANSLFYAFRCLQLRNSYNFNNHSGFGLIITIFLFLILSCDGGAHSQGKILDEQGNPIKDAKVLLEVEKEKFEVRSRGNGFYKLGGTIPPSEKIKLTVTKDGYQTSEETFESQDELKGEHNVVLKKN